MANWRDVRRAPLPKDRAVLVTGDGVYDFGPVIAALPEDSVVGPREFALDGSVREASYDEDSDIWYAFGLAFTENGLPAEGNDAGEDWSDVRGCLTHWCEMPPRPDPV